MTATRVRNTRNSSHIIFMLTLVSFVLSIILVAPEAAQAHQSVILLADKFDGENNGRGQLNYTTFTNWQVRAGTVDLIGPGLYDFLPGNGFYVDLEGTTRDPGVLETKGNFALDPDTYVVQFSIAGSQRGDVNTVTVRFGTLYQEDFILAGNETLQTITRAFTVSTPVTGKFSFELTSGGGDNNGILLDAVYFYKGTLESVIETIQVPADGKPVISTTTLIKGEKYLLRASGTVSINGYIGDAEYGVDGAGNVNNNCIPPYANVDLGIGVDDLIKDDNKVPSWGSYVADHIYTIEYTGKDAPITLDYHDCILTDNIGFLTIEILRFDVPPSLTPVIFVPATFGSFIVRGSTSAPETVWLDVDKIRLSVTDSFLDALRLDETGTRSAFIGGDGQELNPLRVGGVIENLSGVNVYSGMISFLESHGYERNKNLFLFPYDWRKDITLSANQLAALVDSVRLQTGVPKVTLITHSLGGLVAQQYIISGNATKVDQLITLGTPWLGSLRTTQALWWGWDIGICQQVFSLPLNYAIFYCPINPYRINILARNYPSLYTMLPQDDYYSFYDDPDCTSISPRMVQFKGLRIRDTNSPYMTQPRIDYDENACPTTQQFAALTREAHNALIFNRVQGLDPSLRNHSDIINGVKYIHIVGTGVSTPGRIRISMKLQYKLINTPRGYDPLTAQADIDLLDGDDTVPFLSAARCDETHNWNAPSASVYAVSGITHSNLPLNSTVQNMVLLVLMGKSVNQPDVCKPSSAISSATNTMQQTIGGKFNSLNYTIYGAQQVRVVNGQGQDFDVSWASGTKTISGTLRTAQAERILNDGIWLSLPYDQAYTLQITVKSGRAFYLEAQTHQDGILIHRGIFSSLRPQDGARVTIQSTPTQLASASIDQNDDGHIDLSIPPDGQATGMDALDTKVPTISALVDGQPYDETKRFTRLVAIDLLTDDSSAVIKYSLDGGQTYQLYRNQVQIDPRRTAQMIVTATDRVGNQEARTLLIGPYKLFLPILRK